MTRLRLKTVLNMAESSSSELELSSSFASSFFSTGSTGTSTDSASDGSSSEVSTLDPDTDSESDTSTDDQELGTLLEGRTPLYENAPLTILDSYLLLYQYALKNSLTKEAFSGLISLVAAHLPPNAKAATSMYRLKKFFDEKLSQVQSCHHSYCTKCLALLEDAECKNDCGETIHQFLEVSLEIQLKTKLESKFHCILSHVFIVCPGCTDVINGITILFVFIQIRLSGSYCRKGLKVIMVET